MGLKPWAAALVVVGLSGAFFLVSRWAISKLERAMSPKRSQGHRSNHAYDKAKYHDGTVEELGLPERSASLLDVFFLSWVIHRGLTSSEFEHKYRRALRGFRRGELSIQDFYYQNCDACLVSDMLNDEGNAFAMAYFDFQHGDYLNDYTQTLAQNLPSSFHVDYTPENEGRMHAVIDARHAEWKSRVQQAAT